MNETIGDRGGAVAHEDVAPCLPSVTSSAIRYGKRDNKMINPVQGIDTGAEWA